MRMALPAGFSNILYLVCTAEHHLAAYIIIILYSAAALKRELAFPRRLLG